MVHKRFQGKLTKGQVAQYLKDRFRCYKISEDDDGSTWITPTGVQFPISHGDIEAEEFEVIAEQIRKWLEKPRGI